MFARIEVGVKPEYDDPAAAAFLRRIELAHPKVRHKIRWCRLMDVYWVDLPCSREESISAIGEIFWDRVMQWLFTGNLIPAAAGKQGGILDLMEHAPHRPGRFWALERRLRPGVTDNVGRTAREAFEIVLGRKVPEARVASGSLVLLEGPELDEESLAHVARDVFCNELIETWTFLPEGELKKNDRFHQERIRRDLPSVFTLPGAETQVKTYDLEALDEGALAELSRRNLWALSAAEMAAVRSYFNKKAVREKRAELGLGAPTDVELEVVAQTWSEHCKHKIFNARIDYIAAAGGPTSDLAGGDIPAKIESLFKTTISGTTSRLQRKWLLSVFSDNAGIVAFDEEDAFCIKVETHNSPSALDPYGGALTGIVGVNRDILGCGLGAKPIFNTDVFCVAHPDHSDPLPDRLLHPRRILDGVRRGVEDGGNKSGIPTINGALVFDERYLGKPLIYCGTGGFMPRKVGSGEHERTIETKEIKPGDLICMVGGRVGKDGIHGATFSSLALDEFSPVSAVQLGDPITQKRAADFLLEARDLGLYRAITDNGAGGLSSSVGELAQLSGGARLDVSKAKAKYPGLKPYELVVSESQERMTLAVPPDKLRYFLALADRRGVEVSELGTFTDTGRFDIFHGGKIVASLDLDFLHKGAPKLELRAEWRGRPAPPAPPPAAGASATPELSGASPAAPAFEELAPRALTDLLGRPNIASKEWLIRQYDHEVQGGSVIKPLHTAQPGTANACSGPNDAGVVKPKATSDAGLAVGCGINPKLSDIDPFLMAQAAVDEAVRNVLCVGAEYGKTDCVLALVDNFCWPDPVEDPVKAGWLVRACFGLRDAALSLGVPLVSGKDSMKNDFRGRLKGAPVSISVPPTLLMTAVGRVPDVNQARTADFKSPGDVIYRLGHDRSGLWGSELMAAMPAAVAALSSGKPEAPEPAWDVAKRTYAWIGGTAGREQSKLRSLHDVSEGGLLVAIAESLLARGLGAAVQIPSDVSPWRYSFGEGFHAFVATVSEGECEALEAEWRKQEVPFQKVGQVTGSGRLEVAAPGTRTWNVPIKQLRSAWLKEGYWE